MAGKITYQIGEDSYELKVRNRFSEGYISATVAKNGGPHKALVQVSYQQVNDFGQILEATDGQSIAQNFMKNLMQKIVVERIIDKSDAYAARDELISNYKDIMWDLRHH